ncbi:hypothetical protein B0H19DRAFT_1075940 [Mycena capillaripes]|nr:hypothetical protein B0H19DRAFT_1075940 [Mycena capillaripes]
MPKAVYIRRVFWDLKRYRISTAGSFPDRETMAVSSCSTSRQVDDQVSDRLLIFAPPDPSIPSMLSKFVDVEYSSKICKQAYPPREFSQLPPMPNVEDVNRLGGFNIAHDRVAIIDGEVDPWRFDCLHSFVSPTEFRKDTPSRPFKLIPSHFSPDAVITLAWNGKSVVRV